MRDWFATEDGESTRLPEFQNRDRWDGVYEAVTCRRALSPSGLPGIDYALNPYGGCEHGCVYCYAPEVTHSPWETWRVVRVKVNVADRLAAELPGLSGTVGIGTVTDPYQGAEARFMLTRRCLEVLNARRFHVHVHTKSDLVLRDIDLLSGMKCTVGVTVTGLDERGSKVLEPGAPMPKARLKAIRELADAGIRVYALIGPVLDRLDGREEELCDAVAAAGAKEAVLDRLNPRDGLSARLARMGVSGSLQALGKIRDGLEARGISVSDAFPRSRRSRMLSTGGYIDVFL